MRGKLAGGWCKFDKCFKGGAVRCREVNSVRAKKNGGLQVGKPLLVGLTSHFFFGSLCFLDRAVVVAVVAVGVMEVAVDQVIDLIAMGDGGMTAVGAVLVGFIVAVAG